MIVEDKKDKTNKQRPIKKGNKENKPITAPNIKANSAVLFAIN